MITIFYDIYIQIGYIIFFVGLAGILLNRSNILLSIICVEVVFYGLNFLLIAVGMDLQDMEGLVFSLFVLTVAASESAIALALVMMYFKIYNEILLETLE